LLKGALIVMLVAAYALASHFALILPNGQAIAAALALGIPAVLLIGFVFQWVAKRLFTRAVKSTVLPYSALRFGIAAVLAVVPVGLFLWLVWPFFLSNAQALYFAQHVGTNALLAWVFGHTLAAGATPLVVTFARIVHTQLPAEIEAYARKVTVAWTAFFIITCVVSIVLFIATPIAVWSTFGVLLQWPSVAVFFVGEYALRKVLFKDFDHASMQQGFDAYQQHRAAAPAASAASVASDKP
jgi:uncharacterized membrane protein